MSNLSPVYSLEKTLNMTWFLQDLGLTAQEIVECLDTLQNNKDQYGTNNILMYDLIRVVWSLIKCGMLYQGNGQYLLPNHSFMTHNIYRLLEVVLFPIEIWARIS